MRKPKKWSRLDNAAKIFAPTSTSSDTKVFRVVCELLEDVEPRILQNALDQTLTFFPFYRFVIKKGVFWYYLEESDLHAVVRQEDRPPCSAIYSGNRKKLLFGVTYYKRRINLEVHHVLSDGAGTIQFLRTLIFYYLCEKHREELAETELTLDYDASETQRRYDSFSKYYTKQRAFQRIRIPKAYRISGERIPEHRISIIQGMFSTESLRKKAKEYQATVTEFLTAVFISAIGDEMTLMDGKCPVVISVPVNLRQYFPSESARNFFGIINVGYQFDRQDNTLESILAQVKETFNSRLTRDKISERMNKLVSLEHNFFLKIVPLPLKVPIMRYANRLAKSQVTASYSNVGRIEMPESLEKYIYMFDVFFSTKSLQACSVSFHDRFVINFTSAFLSADIQRNFFRKLTGMGLAVEIATNLTGPNEEGEINVL